MTPRPCSACGPTSTTRPTLGRPHSTGARPPGGAPRRSPLSRSRREHESKLGRPSRPARDGGRPLGPRRELELHVSGGLAPDQSGARSANGRRPERRQGLGGEHVGARARPDARSPQWARSPPSTGESRSNSGSAHAERPISLTASDITAALYRRVEGTRPCRSGRVSRGNLNVLARASALDEVRTSRDRDQSRVRTAPSRAERLALRTLPSRRDSGDLEQFSEALRCPLRHGRSNDDRR